MEKLHNDFEAIESVLPGVVATYESLLAKNGTGIYTSNGVLYNHTLFGRDMAMNAKFVSDFDHETAKQVVATLAFLQGTMHNHRTQEEPGRIHHEFRDFREWKGPFAESVVLHMCALFWGAKRGVMQTYFSADTTANYIRLVNKFCHHIDPSFLDHVVRTPQGKKPIADTIEAAADWVVEQVDESGQFMSTHSAGALPYQTFQDSLTAYAWRDGKAVNHRRPHSFIEVQAYGADALVDASRLLSGRSEKAELYLDTAHRMRQALFRDYWNDTDKFFTSVLSERDGTLKPLDVANISAGWTLNTGWWDEVPERERYEKISAIVTRLFSDEFLTDVGLRTRSKLSPEPLGDTVDYHGSQAVWPMYTFMVIEGLRRHHLYELAEQLENRLVNGINALHEYAEFFIVDKNSHLCQVKNRSTYHKVKAQMIPEVDIALTVVPMLVIARRVGTRSKHNEPQTWQKTLQKEVMSRITAVSLNDPTEASAYLDPKPIYLVRSGVSLGSLWHAYAKIAR